MQTALSGESIVLLAVAPELSLYVICVLLSPQTSEMSPFPLIQDFVICLKPMAADDKKVLGTARWLQPGK